MECIAQKRYPLKTLEIDRSSYTVLAVCQSLEQNETNDECIAPTRHTMTEHIYNDPTRLKLQKEAIESSIGKMYMFDKYIRIESWVKSAGEGCIYPHPSLL
ncbi:hypothetical protein EIN_229620 [Entamoeba invadens IP1]|uniref:Uncharacterized protein n=1 Tax=Entamoeba invadens IP1 TaxID=370355 RepID=A0A0A1U328_ENTIV|nr:hypothetical protein EIN_229620 [Entamoeba invadens IP1]ELP88429.1 hypothetical protein EIN_229620 [Entamoeba invadens IP1]|eukprot:XP_004255200.1 hypothetical protein EIN_229620 [Entamoeba invadens IP1]